MSIGGFFELSLRFGSLFYNGRWKRGFTSAFTGLCLFKSGFRCSVRLLNGIE
jgi:hypothetical protein